VDRIQPFAIDAARLMRLPVSRLAGSPVPPSPTSPVRSELSNFRAQVRARTLHEQTSTMRPLPTIVRTLFLATSLVACVGGGDDDAAEDAAADAAPSGKADAFGFSVGPYSTFEIEQVDREAVMAVFHEDGQMDFTRIAGEYDTEYLTGTYKLYRYAGRDRIRLTDDDGRVILRSDWAREADGGLMFADKSWYQPRMLPDDVLDCVTMHVRDSGVFEEGLSVYEYPGVSVTREGTGLALHLGASYFDASEAEVTLSTEGAESVATATTSDDFVYGLRVANTAPRRGEVFYQETKSSPRQVVADVVCR
jgi:hypothetical protein